MELALIGWLGNACFFSRFIVQWWRSEQVGRSVAPAIFWHLSLVGAACLAFYTLVLGEPVLLVGHAVNFALYGRNLWLARPDAAGRGLPLPATIGLGLLAAALLLFVVQEKARAGLADSPVWLAVSIVGQSLWSTRFLIQWMATERRGDSHFPLAFWWVSLAGNSLLLAYALQLLDPVIVAGYVLGPIVQVRNLVLETRARAAGPSSTGS